MTPPMILWRLAAVAALAQPRADLVPNGGFEGIPRTMTAQAATKAQVGGTIATGWVDNSEWARVNVRYEQRSDRPHGGERYQRITVSKADEGWGQMACGPLELKAGTVYALEAWLRSPTNTAAKVVLRQPGPPYETFVEAVSTGRSAWQRVGVRYRSPGDRQAVLLILPDGVGTVDIDDVSLRVVSEGTGSRPQPGNLAPVGRLGAGAAGGWSMSQTACTWGIDGATGPLGPGAAKLVMAEGGSCDVSFPTRYLRPNVEHTLSLWARIGEGSARAMLVLGRNEGGEEAVLHITPSAEWRQYTQTTKLSPSNDGRYFVRLAVAGGPATLFLDGLSLRETALPPTADLKAGVGIEPTEPWGLYTGREPIMVRVRAAGATQPGRRLNLRIVHTNGRSANLLPIALDTSGAFARTVALDHALARLNGLMRVEAVAVDPSGRPISPPAETLVARVPAPVQGPRPNSPFGTHVTLREPDVSVVAKLGFKWCRLHDASILTKWALAEPQPGKWVFYDAEMRLARKRGLNILGMLCSSPPWASGHADEQGYFAMYYPPRDIDQWRTYVRAVVGHYKGLIDRWEVWNEPWVANLDQGFFRGGTPAQYAVLLKAAYEEAKRANPACTVVGIDTYPDYWDQKVLAEGTLPYFDVLSFHRYESSMPAGPNDVFARVAVRIRSEQAKYGSPKPLENTEGGPGTTGKGSFFSFADPDDDGDWSRWADQVPRYYLGNIAAGVTRFYLYSLHNAGRFAQPSNWMLTEPGYLLKPLTVTTSVLASFVEGATWRKRVTPAPGASAHLFEQKEPRWYSKAPCLLAVLIADGEEDVPLRRALPANASYYDRWGNRILTPKVASRSPVYIVATGKAREELGTSMR